MRDKRDRTPLDGRPYARHGSDPVRQFPEPSQVGKCRAKLPGPAPSTHALSTPSAKAPPRQPRLLGGEAGDPGRVTAYERLLDERR